jgi:hypothetical protein
MDLEQLQNALFGLYDIRNALPAKTKAMPSADAGSDYSINDALTDAIEFLESLEAECTQSES